MWRGRRPKSVAAFARLTPHHESSEIPRPSNTFWKNILRWKFLAPTLVALGKLSTQCLCLRWASDQAQPNRTPRGAKEAANDNLEISAFY